MYCRANKTATLTPIQHTVGGGGQKLPILRRHSLWTAPNISWRQLEKYLNLPKWRSCTTQFWKRIYFICFSSRKTSYGNYRKQATKFLSTPFYSMLQFDEFFKIYLQNLRARVKKSVKLQQFFHYCIKCISFSFRQTSYGNYCIQSTKSYRHPFIQCCLSNETYGQITNNRIDSFWRFTSWSKCNCSSYELFGIWHWRCNDFEQVSCLKVSKLRKQIVLFSFEVHTCVEP